MLVHAVGSKCPGSEREASRQRRTVRRRVFSTVSVDELPVMHALHGLLHQFCQLTVSEAKVHVRGVVCFRPRFGQHTSERRPHAWIRTYDIKNGSDCKERPRSR